MALDPQLQSDVARLSQLLAETGRLFNQLSPALNKIATTSSALGDNITANTKKVNSAFDTFSSSLTSYSQRVKKASEIQDYHNNQLTAAQKDELEQYNRRINGESQFFSKKARYEGEALRQLASDLKEQEQLNKRSQDLAQQHYNDLRKERAEVRANKTAIAAQYAAGKQAVDAAVQQLSKASEDLSKLDEIDTSKFTNISQRIAHDSAVNLARQAQDAAQLKLDQEQALHGHVIGEYEGFVAALKENKAQTKQDVQVMRMARDETRNFAKALQEAEAKIEANKTDERSEKLGESIADFKKGIKDGIKGIFSNNILAKVSVAAGVKGVVEEVRTGINRGMNLLNPSEQLTVATKFGMSPQEFMEATGEFRSAFVAAGGLGEGMQNLETTVDSLRGHVASNAEATKFGLQQMQSFTNIGVKAGETQMVRMTKSYAKLHAATGMTVDQFNTSIRDIVESEENIYAMRLANSEAERDAIQETIVKRYEENRLRGISDEQTKAMIKEQQKMAKEKPLTRLQKAIKMGAFANMMGVGGGDELMRFSMKAPGTLTKAEQARQAEIYGQISAAKNQQMGGSFQSQVMTSVAMGGLDVDEGQLDTFNTQLTQPVKEGLEAELDANTNALKSFGQVNDTLVAANTALETGIGLLKNNIVMLIGGVIANTAAIIANTAALLLGKKGIGELIDKFKKFNFMGKVAENAKNAAAGVSTGVAGAASRIAMAKDVAKDAFKTVATSKLVGGLSALTGIVEGVSNYDSKKKNGGESVGLGVGSAIGGLGGASGGAAIGATIGTLIAPGIGTAIGGWLGSAAGGYLLSKGVGELGKSMGASIDKSSSVREAQEQERARGEAAILSAKQRAARAAEIEAKQQANIKAQADAELARLAANRTEEAKVQAAERKAQELRGIAAEREAEFKTSATPSVIESGAKQSFTAGAGDFDRNFDEDMLSYKHNMRSLFATQMMGLTDGPLTPDQEMAVDDLTDRAVAKGLQDLLNTVNEQNAKAARIKDNNAPPTTPREVQQNNQPEADARSAKKSKVDEMEDEDAKLQNNINQQLLKMDTTNNHLQATKDGIATLIEIAQKQLIMAAATDDEKKTNRKNIGSGLQLANYQYIG